jgi:hypothetical protein
MSTMRIGSPGAMSDSSALNRFTAVCPIRDPSSAGSSLSATMSRTPTASAPGRFSWPSRTGYSTADRSASPPLVVTRTRSIASSTRAVTGWPSRIDEGRIPSSAGTRCSTRLLISSGKATWSGRSDSFRAKAMSPMRRPRSSPTPTSGAPAGVETTVRRPVAGSTLRARPMWTVLRSTNRSSGSSGSGRSMIGPSIRPSTVPYGPSASGSR